MNTEKDHYEAARPGLGHLGVFAVCYLIAAWLGMMLAVMPGYTATLWPAGGLYLALLLFYEPRSWFRLVATAMAAEIFGDLLLFDFSLPVSIAMACGSTLEALTSAWLVGRFCGQPFRFQTLRDVLGLIAFAAIGSPVVGATVGAAAMAAAGLGSFTTVWPLWWIRDSAGVLVSAPLALVVLQGQSGLWEVIRTRWAEAVALTFMLFAVAYSVFSGTLPITYLIVPPLLWAALRFGMPGAVLAMVILTAEAIRYTTAGQGPFASEAVALEARALLVQSFIGITAVSTLVLAALTQQRQSAIRDLRRARDELDQRVAERTEALRHSEVRFLDMAANVPGVVYQWSERANGTFGFTYASPRIAEYFQVPADRPDDVLALLHPDDVAGFRASVEASKKELKPWQFEGRFIDARDRSVRWWRAMSRPVSADEKEILYNGVLFDVTGEKLDQLALAASVDQLRSALLEQAALLASSPAGFSIVNEQRIITSANEAMLRMLGCTADELIGKSTREFFVSGEQWQEFGHEGYEQMRLRGMFRAEVQYRRKDGSRFWGLVQGVQIDPTDASRGRMYAIVDITEQKDAQNKAGELSEELERRVRERTAALSESEARNRAMLDLSTDWYWEQDAEFRYARIVGNAPLNAFGSEAYLGKMPWELPILGVSEAQWAEHRATLDAHRPFRHFVHQLRNPDGSLRTASSSGEPVFGDDGQLLGYRGIGSDITEREKMIEALRDSESMLSLITDNVPAMIAYFDAALTCRFANPEFTRAFDALGKDIVGRHLQRIVGEQNYAAVRGFFGEVVARGDVHFEHRFALPGGHDRTFSVVLVPDLSAAGAAAGCYALFRDITDQKAAEGEIRQLNVDLEHRVQDRTRQLIATNRELEAFSYSVSHDLQAPLRRIERYADMLAENNGAGMDDTGRDMLRRIQEASSQTKRLIADILKLAQISRAELHRVAVDLSAMARRAMEQIEHAASPARRVEVSVEPGIIVDADAAMLQILLDNLLGNAWKFTARTEQPSIRVGAIEPTEGKGFYIQDNGAGFDMRYANKLFGAFQRLHGQDEFKGTGIGLAIVQRIVNVHGWQIHANGETGRGATFTIRAH